MSYETDENKQTKIKAMTANIEALDALLQDAAARIKESHEAIKQGERNQAIGAICDFDDLLAEAAALFKAATVLHRSKFAR